MAHTSPEMDTNQVPERPGALGLPEKDPGSDLRHRSLVQPLDGCVRRGAEGSQPELRGFIVKEPDQQEQEGTTHQARSPKCPCQTEVGEQHRDQGNGQHRSQALHGLQDAHGHAQVGPEPDGDPGHQRHLIDRQWDGQEDAEGQIKMPRGGSCCR